MNRALYPGSFDPPTWGHIQIIRRAAKLFDELIVGIGDNFEKGKGLLTTQEKIDGLKEEIGDLQNVEILKVPGLTVDFAKEIGAHVLLRSLRSSGDLEFEMQMARANYKLKGMETLFMAGDDETSTISSSLIRELAANGAPLKEFIPSYFESLLHNKRDKLWNKEQ
ncbi:MAG: pantetheine-phosphate adenylyltransferase [Simkaniaceae bacterium]|nr:pantetheine-phosphate adenylyltransferase [Candidatus Sacchlamyda saccharinae]